MRGDWDYVIGWTFVFVVGLVLAVVAVGCWQVQS